MTRFASLGVLALTLALCYGVWYSYSVVMVALLKEFGWSRSVLAGAFSVFTLTHGAASPLVGWLCERIQPAKLVALGGVALGVSMIANSYVTQPWQLYIGFGGFTALAVAAAGWIPAVVQTQRRHADKLGLALGIVSSGVGVGMLLTVPFCQWVIDSYGWRTAFRALGVICTAVIVPSALYLLRTAPAPRANSSPVAGTSASVELPASTGGMTLGEAAHTLPFWLIVAAFVLGNICSQTLHVHQVAYLVDHGISAIVAATVVSVVGASSIAAKIIGGWLSDRIDREVVYMTCITILVAAIAVLVTLGTSSGRWGAYLYAMLLGIGYSVTASLMPALTSDRFGGPHYGTIIGVGLFGSAVGSAFGPWLAGWLFDLTGSYAVPLAIAAACGVLAGVSGWVLWRLRLRAAR